MTTFRKKNNVLTPTGTVKNRIKALPGIQPDEVTTVQQVFSTINTFTSAQTFSGGLILIGVTDSSSKTTGDFVTSGGVGISKNITIGGELVTSKLLVANHTAVPINTTGAGTLAVVTSGVIAGLITSTSAAAVTITLDSVANMIAAFSAVNVAITTGTNIQFIIDNSQGANTVTLAVDSGATIAVATPAITGGATLTISTANKIGLFNLYLTSATTAILSRVI